MEHDRDVIGPRRARYEQLTAVPMLVVAAAFLVFYSVFVLAPDVDIDPALRTVSFVILIVAWIVFVFDYVVRLVLSRGHRWTFVRGNPIDLLAVFLPAFRAFRLLRSLREVRYFRSRTGAAVRTQVLLYAGLFVVLFVYMIALAELQAERYAPGATITNFGDALWWACVTVATVGYGDTYPVTGEGRFFAVLLMIGGVAIVGTASALVVSYIGEHAAPLSRQHQGNGAQRERESERAESPAAGAGDDGEARDNGAAGDA